MRDDLLVLWDIDLTLIRTAGVAAEAYAAAVEETIGGPWRGDLTFNGLTERAMATRILRMHDVEPNPELLARFLATIERALLDRADATKARGFALPGAHAALRAVAAESGVRQSVLTGNIRSVAEMKLRAFELDPWIDFDIGAYGDDEFERNALVPHAWRRAETRYGQTYLPARTVVLGDTVRDVEAALAHGAAVVAVASGTTSGAALRAAGAEVVLDDLTDTGRVLAAIERASVVAAAVVAAALPAATSSLGPAATSNSGPVATSSSGPLAEPAQS